MVFGYKEKMKEKEKPFALFRVLGWVGRLWVLVEESFLAGSAVCLQKRFPVTVPFSSLWEDKHVSLGVAEGGGYAVGVSLIALMWNLEQVLSPSWT